MAKNGEVLELGSLAQQQQGGWQRIIWRRFDLRAIYRRLGWRFRQKRLRWLEAHFSDCASVLDIGGHPNYWKHCNWRPRHLTLLNLALSGQTLPSGVQEITGDGCALALPDRSFDLVMSNSVIEHVADHAKFASESLRVGKRLYCQTPSKWFPVEPHYLGLFVHWLPKRFFTHFVHRYLTIAGLLTKPDAATTEESKNEIHLLGKTELRHIFPGCAIETERFLGLPKSYMVWR
jgi:hypothetical protein